MDEVTRATCKGSKSMHHAVITCRVGRVGHVDTSWSTSPSSCNYNSMQALCALNYISEGSVSISTCKFEVQIKESWPKYGPILYFPVVESLEGSFSRPICRIKNVQCCHSWPCCQWTCCTSNWVDLKCISIDTCFLEAQPSCNCATGNWVMFADPGQE